MTNTQSSTWHKAALDAIFQGRAKQRKTLTEAQMAAVGHAVAVYAQARQYALQHPSSDATAALFGHVTTKDALNDACSLLISLGLDPSDIPLLDGHEPASQQTLLAPAEGSSPTAEPVFIQFVQAALI
jgi:hypothetical protein